MAPVAKNGPNGIFISSLGLNIIKYINPVTDPITEPISKLIQHPTMPVNDPIHASKSRSPWPMPFLPVKRLNICATVNKKKQPSPVPITLSAILIGKRSNRLKSRAKGIKKSVMNLEISNVSMSERMVTTSAEKNTK